MRKVCCKLARTVHVNSILCFKSGFVADMKLCTIKLYQGLINFFKLLFSEMQFWNAKLTKWDAACLLLGKQELQSVVLSSR